MHIAESAVPGRAPIGRSIFRIQLRSGIWGVKLDGQFYGDYRTLNMAMEGVGEKARLLQAAGRSVHIVTLSAGGAVVSSKVAHAALSISS
jgi:hypothetical protein